MLKMKSLLLLVVGLFMNAQSFAHSSSRLGLGVMLGEPTGVSAKYWLDSRSAADFNLAYSFDHFLLGTADYVLHFENFIPASGQHIHPYAGVGAVLAFAAGSSSGKGFAGDGNSSFGLGIRVPLGLEWVIQRLGIFVEIAPGIGVIPGTFSFVNGGIGVRYFF